MLSYRLLITTSYCLTCFMHHATSFQIQHLIQTIPNKLLNWNKTVPKLLMENPRVLGFPGKTIAAFILIGWILTEMYFFHHRQRCHSASSNNLGGYLLILLSQFPEKSLEKRRFLKTSLSLSSNKSLLIT